MVDNSERSIALVVEDDPWIRLLLRDLLTDEGYAVLETSNGSAALRLAQRQPPALVLLDLILPEQSGLDLLTELKSTRATAHVPVIAVSARTDLLARVAELADAGFLPTIMPVYMAPFCAARVWYVQSGSDAVPAAACLWLPGAVMPSVPKLAEVASEMRAWWPLITCS